MSMMWGQSSAARILCIVCTFYTFAVVAAASNSTSPAAIGASLVDEESGEVVAAGQPAPKGQSVSKWQHIMTKRRGKKGLKTRRRGRPNGRPNNRQPGQAPSRQQRPNRPNNRPSRQQRPNRQQNNNNNQPNRQDTNDSSAQNAIQSPSCFSVEIYDDIDRDIGRIKSSIRNDEDRSHFLGGIVRLAAHDFMDFNPRTNPQFGPDGCFDANHASNAGLDTIWCRSCPLKILYDEKYSHLSRADYWIAAANAVVRQTSVNKQLDLKDTFVWGRKDRDVCRGSGDRLPQASDCGEVEDVFLKRMGLEWKDAVALLGAHTLGRGDAEVSVYKLVLQLLVELKYLLSSLASPFSNLSQVHLLISLQFSGHDGTWVESDSQATVSTILQRYDCLWQLMYRHFSS